jgi:adenine phosphoribosyltransferase
MEHLKALIRDVPDFPIEGILFKDITTLLKDPQGLAETIEALVAQYEGQEIDLVAGMESRGFIFGVPLALAFNAGFVAIRKPGKLPAETIHREYALEYGTNRLEVHRDAIQPGQRVLLVDDLLATGGTAKASAELIEELGGEIVGAAFVIELEFLNGRQGLGDYEVFSLLKY